jgi:exonuclease III
MRIVCWNVNSLVPTVRNINLKYGSLAAFFQHLDADIICMQVSAPLRTMSAASACLSRTIARWAM